MSVKETKDVVNYSNLQLRNKINKLKMKYDTISPEDKAKLEVMKKEAWKRGMDDVI